jgi:hypothetical protein
MKNDCRLNLISEARHLSSVGSLIGCFASALIALGFMAVGQGSQALAQSAEKLVPLRIEYPKPPLEGTPENINVPNLEKPSSKPREPFLVPTGVTNIAKGKPVTSTEKSPLMGDLSMITDGDKTQSMDCLVELGPGVQNVTIDLGGNYEVYGVLFWHSYIPRAYIGIVVQLAEDKDFTKGVQTIFNNDRENKDGQGAGMDKNYIENYQGRLVDAKGTRARYVRLWSRGNSNNNLNDYIEIEVYGRPAA